MVNLVLRDPIWGSPSKLVRFLAREESFPYNEPILHKKVTKHFAVLIHNSFNMSPYGCFSVSVLRAQFCIQVTDNHGEVSHLPLSEGSLELVVNVRLLFSLTVIHWCIGLNVCGVLTLRFETRGALNLSFVFDAQLTFFTNPRLPCAAGFVVPFTVIRAVVCHLAAFLISVLESFS